MIEMYSFCLGFGLGGLLVIFVFDISFHSFLRSIIKNLKSDKR
jgi:hypothetical protein